MSRYQVGPYPQAVSISTGRVVNHISAPPSFSASDAESTASGTEAFMVVRGAEGCITDQESGTILAILLITADGLVSFQIFVSKMLRQSGWLSLKQRNNSGQIHSKNT